MVLNGTCEMSFKNKSFLTLHYVAQMGGPKIMAQHPFYIQGQRGNNQAMRFYSPTHMKLCLNSSKWIYRCAKLSNEKIRWA